MTRYADEIMIWLKELGFTHCFMLAGGGSMHLVDAASKIMRCIPVVHEVTAVIAAEYFNDTAPSGEKAFALVTTGPGLTNTLTGVTGAWLESRPLLVLAGQVKKSDLKSADIRQRGIQEVDGISIFNPITKKAIRISDPIRKEEFKEIVLDAELDRPGPVLIEVCIDVSAKPFEAILFEGNFVSVKIPSKLKTDLPLELISLIQNSERPLILLGGGTSRAAAKKFLVEIETLGVPVACTWGGSDRVSSDYPYYAGRPNTYGMRWSNIFQQQADLLIAVGTSLGIQQTGFNWQDYLPVGKIVHVNIDEAELEKGHPKTEIRINMDSAVFLPLFSNLAKQYWAKQKFENWTDFLNLICDEVPIIEPCHKVGSEYIDPYKLISGISSKCQVNDVITPCSSGGTYTAFNQAFVNTGNQKITSNKGLASMGYGLAGAIGASLANPLSRIVHFEGDGGFLQNIQDLSTVKMNELNIKMFLISNGGYASIRTSQKSYFNGNYVGCDIETGLGIPNWEDLFKAYEIEFYTLNPFEYFDDEFEFRFNSIGPQIFIANADPEQLYLPKVASKINLDGSMSSAAIHDMSPKLSNDSIKHLFKFLPNKLWGQ